MIYNIIEIANTHGGNIAYIKELLEEFSKFQDGFGVKFQPFRYDDIATEDYDYYSIYKKLYIQEEYWKEIIIQAKETKDVWLDIFDSYGTKILASNINNISGIKLQASVLYNRKVLNELSRLDLKKIKVIINISSYEIDEIKERISEIEGVLRPCEILVELGFQAYPTDIRDSGLGKIKELKSYIKNSIVFADHVDGNSQEATELPIKAFLLGADVIEKHVMHSTLYTEYDGFSSVNINVYEEYINKLMIYTDVIKRPFISEKEREYLKKTIQIPILNKGIRRGNLVDLDKIAYKRSGKQGLNTVELENQVRNHNLLRVDKEKGDTLEREDFKKATIATIIACRLKSTRLPRKAILKIGEYSSIELCIKNTLKFNDINHTILATSTTDEDEELINYRYRDDVIFHRGHPDDVIERYLDITRKMGIDIVVRVTGDCPFHSKDILHFLLESHFATGADYTSGIGASVGTNLEIINVSALERVKRYFPHADYSEYMTWYFVNNPDYFNLNMVKLPQKWCRDYRLTLDYPEDLVTFLKIQEYFEKENLEYTIEALYNFLDNNESISNINKHIGQKYSVDENLITKLNVATKIKEEQ